MPWSSVGETGGKEKIYGRVYTMPQKTVSKKKDMLLWPELVQGEEKQKG
jgi:hypothetical protein